MIRGVTRGLLGNGAMRLMVFGKSMFDVTNIVSIRDDGTVIIVHFKDGPAEGIAFKDPVDLLSIRCWIAWVAKEGGVDGDSYQVGPPRATC